MMEEIPTIRAYHDVVSMAKKRSVMWNTEKKG